MLFAVAARVVAAAAHRAAGFVGWGVQDQHASRRVRRPAALVCKVAMDSSQLTLKQKRAMRHVLFSVRLVIEGKIYDCLIDGGATHSIMSLDRGCRDA